MNPGVENFAFGRTRALSPARQLSPWWKRFVWLKAGRTSLAIPRQKKSNGFSVQYRKAPKIGQKPQ
jgi:hypothetical protein